MSIIRSAYRTFTAAMIKARASVPAQSGMTIDGNDVTCKYIETARIRNAIGAVNEKFSELCTHANINPWSAFGPKIRSTSGSGYDKILVNSNPSIFSIEDFAGYNHNAPVPGWQSGGQAAAEANNWVNSGSQAVCNANIDIGEIDWAGEVGAVGIAMLIFDGTDNIVGLGYTALSGIGSNFTLSGNTTIGGGIVLDKLDWYAMAFIVDQEITNPEDVISAVICRVPNISTWEINLKVKPATYVSVDSAGFNITGAGWSNYPTLGRVAISDGTYAGYHDEVRLYMNIYDLVNEEMVGSDVLVNTWYNWSPTDQMFGNEAQPNGEWEIPAFGYQCNIRVEVVDY